MAIGLVEIRSAAIIYVIADSMLKSSEIKLLACKNSGSAYKALLFEGQVSSLSNAVASSKSIVSEMWKFAKTNAPISYEYGLARSFSSIILNRPAVNVYDIFFQNIKVPKAKYEKGKTYGFIDTKGLIPSVAAADIMAKQADIKLMGYERMGSGELSVVICGLIESVEAAIRVGVEEGKKYGKVSNWSIVPNASKDMISMFA